MQHDSVTIELSNVSVSKLENLVYFSEYSISTGENGKTLQAKLENGTAHNGSPKRQSTRYGVHGLHEYKGKFNPQIVRCILNTHKLNYNAHILDPFCGSGTTLVESLIAGYSAIGLDSNPFAIYLTNAKIMALRADPAHLKNIGDKIFNDYDKQTCALEIQNDARSKYLSSWFPEENLKIIETFKYIISEQTAEFASIFLIILSDLLRDYSLQEPSDLRIRRRISPFPQETIRERFNRDVQKKIDAIQASHSIYGNLKPKAMAYYTDGRQWTNVQQHGVCKNSVDFALTSPPYATALPYIDTQRLSLVWLGLLNPGSIRQADETLIGSREASKAKLQQLSIALLENRAKLPKSAWEYCKLLQSHVADSDGFRRKAVPSLLYQYFSDMMNTFVTVKSVMKSGGLYALVVGSNRTTLGGTQFNIDTPRFLNDLAEHKGWSIVEVAPLETYRNYSGLFPYRLHYLLDSDTCFVV